MKMKAVRARAIVRMEDSGTVLEAILEHMREHAIVERHGTGARLTSQFGTVDVSRLVDTVEVDVAAGSVVILAMMKMFIAEHVYEFAGKSASIVWSGRSTAGSTPPQFQQATVARVFDVTPRMRRVVLSCPDVSVYREVPGYHVRLLIPPAGRVPHWPALADDGRMVWPTGEDALISRVYTIRAIDTAARTVSIDFVLHGGLGSGPGADFARHAQPGDAAGILGPGGDGYPEARRLLLFGDEAALPAIARMLEQMPADGEAKAFIEIEDESEAQPIIPAGAAVVTWLHRQGRQPGSTALLDEALESSLGSEEDGDRFVWGGCETAVATRLRAKLKSRLPHVKGRHRIYGYWSRHEE
jgi:NADPH-dependent ferric siderophore reductase